MIVPADSRLSRLLQLASPTLPVGAYSYSQGLEAAIEAGVVKDATSAGEWIEDVLEFSVSRFEAPILLRLIAAWHAGDLAGVRAYNQLFLAGRETSELRAESVQMGYSLKRLLVEIGEADVSAFEEAGLSDESSFPAVFAYAVWRWGIDPGAALLAYLWAWLENQTMAAVKALPLGQTDGQRLLFLLGARLEEATRRAATMNDDAVGSFAPRLAIFSSRHEVQYSRLFRS